jgi:hypothetical protein
MQLILMTIAWTVLAVAMVIVGMQTWRKPIQADRRRILVRAGLWGFGLWFVLALAWALIGETRLGPFAWLLLHPVAVSTATSAFFARIGLWATAAFPFPLRGLLVAGASLLLASALFWAPLLALRSRRVPVRIGAGLQVVFFVVALLAALLLQA